MALINIFYLQIILKLHIIFIFLLCNCYTRKPAVKHRLTGNGFRRGGKGALKVIYWGGGHLDFTRIHSV